MLQTINIYTGNTYRNYISNQLYHNKREAYDALPSSYRSEMDAIGTDRFKENYRKINEAQELLAALPVWEGGEIYRGMRLGSAENRLKHLEILTNGPIEQTISFSSRMDKAEGFNNGDYPIIFHIKEAKTMASVMGLSGITTEYEVLGNKYTKFKVEKLSLFADGRDPFGPDDPRARQNKKLHVFLVEV